MADQSYIKDQKSQRSMVSQTPVEDARTTRGCCDADTSWAKGNWIHSSRGCVGCNMASYTHRELANMHLVYLMTNCNGRKALGMYSEKCPSRQMRSHSYSASIHRKLCETGSLDMHKPELVATGRLMPKKELPKHFRVILQQVYELYPERPISPKLPSGALYMMKDFNPYHLQRVHYKAHFKLEITAVVWILRGGICKKRLPPDISLQVFCSRMRLHSH